MEDRYDKYPRFDLWRIELDSSNEVQAKAICNLVKKEEEMRVSTWSVSPHSGNIMFCHFFRPELTEWTINKN